MNSIKWAVVRLPTFQACFGRLPKAEHPHFEPNAFVATKTQLHIRRNYWVVGIEIFWASKYEEV